MTNNKWLFALVGVLLVACAGMAGWLFLGSDSDAETKAEETYEVSRLADHRTNKKAKKKKAKKVAKKDVADEAESAEKEAEAAETTRTRAVASHDDGVYMGLWGRIGDSDDVDFEMNGKTGHYSYRRAGTASGQRTLKLVSYDKRTGRVVLDAFMGKQKIGVFDGMFDEISETDDEGYEHYGQSYVGKFTSTKGIVLDFSLYFD